MYVNYNMINCNYGKCNLWQVFHGNRIMASVVMTNVFMAKVL